ncbi:MAG: hypothetical protein ABIZ36_12030 [Gemmatimonadaceae bacterium]
MKNISKVLLVVSLGIRATPSLAQTPAPTPQNLYVADVKYENGTVRISNPRKLTGDRGVNSQPSFTPDGKSILFVSRRDTTGQSDVYQIDLASGVETQVTRTPENENTPTVTPDGNLMVIRWVPATLFKEWGPWIYKNGQPMSGVLPAPDTVGYYVRVDSKTFAMMRPKSRPAVALFDSRKRTMTDYAWPVANLPPQLVPGRHAISFTKTDSLGRNQISMLNLRTLQSSTVAPALVGRVVHSWTRNGFVLMGKGNSIYALKPGPAAAWRKIAEMKQPDLQSVSTYVVSPRGDKVILISPLMPTLQQALRDSIQAGRSVADVIRTLRKGGATTVAGYDLAEGGILALADDRATHGTIADAIDIIRFDIELHPTSYDARMALGSALRKSGDSAAAISAYRKSLELNPRYSSGEKKDAEAAEKAIAELGAH